MTLDENNGAGTDRLLNGWKEIAAFFRKDERTMRRWAATMDLPVHRVHDAKRGTVYAYAGDLEQWLKRQRQNLNGDDVAELPVETAAVAPVQTTPEPAASGGRPARWRWLIFAALIVAAATGTWAMTSFRQAAVAPPPQNRPSQQVYDLYLNGIYLSQKRTPEGLAEAIKIFEKVTALDSSFAPGFAELAAAYELSVDYVPGPTAESYQRAEAAANKAIALDPTLPTAQAVLADVEFYWSRKYSQALARFERAIELDPNLAQTRQWYAEALLYMGRCREALVQADKAQALDPKSRSILAAKAHVLFCSGDLRQSEALFRQLVANEPDYPTPYLYLALIALDRGDYADYLDWQDKIADAMESEASRAILAAARAGLAEGGSEGMAAAMVVAAKPYYDAGEIPAYYMAHFHALKNDATNAAFYLQAALDLQQDDVFEYSIDPAFKRVRTNPEFMDKVAASGLPIVPEGGN